MIEIVKCGPQTTIQDHGREGYSRYGVGKSGALDQLALRLGNLLVGNTGNEAAIEILVHPLIVRFEDSYDISVTGADACLEFNDGSKELWPAWTRFKVQAGEQLTIGPARGGTISYLCVRAGLDVEPIMESRSTDLKGKFGGFQGRMLQPKDRLQGLKNENKEMHSLGIIPPYLYPKEEVIKLRMIAGLELAYLDEEQQKNLFSTEWIISRQSNRVGCLLEGNSINFETPIEMLSHGLLPGLVQLPPSGKPIILQQDAQVSGGYPRLGCIIEEDLRFIAQARPGQKICLVCIAYDEAINIKKGQELYLLEIARLLEAQDVGY
ncbi:biotin-dependent carboxyltransferase family protein [Halomonas sp. HAL1]|uniref:5-oxoprolinase subunit C family protein n=1 Tax=Halomonas sp. HAL1 TaxID=550984 RepID=UPI00022D27B2|nr:biotin-dependent carboxyltransferase family protein [Halomonas sp. HAL1]EHA15093.1 allophanate hydrolase subunit 2 [Halomonas sp. HAL1]WKV94166.1 biotin-dependent carboxyltransferase family protein [Halomonas sp. HAL1]